MQFPRQGRDWAIEFKGPEQDVDVGIDENENVWKGRENEERPSPQPRCTRSLLSIGRRD